MVRWLARLLCLWACLGPAHAEAVPAKDAYLIVEADQLSRKPFEQEMILLTVRGFYFVPITLEKLLQPDLDDFGWMQLGRDHWFETMIEGRRMRAYERRIAVFPKQKGTLSIGSFTHRMTLLDSAGKRFSYDVKSQPLKLDVARKPQGIAWWLPARSVQITDTWDKQPESLAFGESAQRTITFMANGAGPEMLPPAPKMAGRGLIAFPDPEERTVELTKDGPISKVVWRWTVRILSPDFGALETDPLEWFDTQSLTPQKITFAPQKVALAGSITAPPPSQGASPGFMQTHAIPLAVLAGLLMGLSLIVPGWRLRSWAEISHPFRPALPISLRRKIVRAARENDARSMWLALRRHNVPPTEQLDRILFGRDPPPVSDMSAISRNIVRR